MTQGALDPLNDAKSRANQLGALCPNVEVVLLQAGESAPWGGELLEPHTVRQCFGLWALGVRLLGRCSSASPCLVTLSPL